MFGFDGNRCLSHLHRSHPTGRIVIAPAPEGSYNGGLDLSLLAMITRRPGRSTCTIKIVCAVAVAWAFNQHVCAQVVETIPGPILETRPENGTPIAATAQTNSIFSPPRGLTISTGVVGGYDDNPRRVSATAAPGRARTLLP